MSFFAIFGGCFMLLSMAFSSEKEWAHRSNAPMMNLYLMDENDSEIPKGFDAYGGKWSIRIPDDPDAPSELWSDAGLGPKLIQQGMELSEGEIFVEIFIPDVADGNAGIMIQVTNPGIGADNWTGYEIALDATAQEILFGKHEQNFTPIRRVRYPIPIGKWVEIRVRFDGGKANIFLDGKEACSVEDMRNPLVSGAVGFRPWQKSIGYRNFRIRGKTGDLEYISFCRSSSLEPISATNGNGSTHRIVWRSSEKMPLRWKKNADYYGYMWIETDDDSMDDSLQIFVNSEDMESCEVHEFPVTSISLVDFGADTNHLWRVVFHIKPNSDTENGRISILSSDDFRIRRIYIDNCDDEWSETLSCKTIFSSQNEESSLSSKRVPVLFMTRYPLTAPPAVGLDIWASRPTAPGCSIRIWNPEDTENDVLNEQLYDQSSIRMIFEDPKGSIYDMNLSLDGKTIYFSYCGENDGKYWSIWKIDVDGTGLSRLTNGPFYDISPCELPDGTIVFVSTRSPGYTVCQPGPASNLYRMNEDGTEIHCISMNTLSDMSPQLLDDGRILFTRWEYIDRDLTYRQSLWTQHPDGTNYRLFFGNTVRDVGTFWQARPLLGEVDRVVATFAPHHSYPHGAIGIIDRKYGMESPRETGFTYITNEIDHVGDVSRPWACRDPFPITDRTFMASIGDEKTQRFRIFALDIDNHRRLLFEDSRQSCFYPMRVEKRSNVNTITSIVDSKKIPDMGVALATNSIPNGVILLTDVYRGMEPTVMHGQAKTLRIMEQVRKSEDLVNRAFDQSPVMSYGTYYAKRCWGEVSIEADGSAFFETPALREVYFQVLDADGKELHRMTSAIQVMPGERLGCVGCHESRNTISPDDMSIPVAAMKPPQSIRMRDDLVDGIVDFCTFVQPVLDRYCLSCHDGAAPAGGYDLSSDKTRYFNMAYDNLLGRSRSYRQHNMETGEMLPEEAKKGWPLVHFYWLLWTPTAVNRPLWSGTHVSRLSEFFEYSHCGQEIPDSERRKVWLWIDANVPYYSTYAHSRPMSPGRRDRWTDASNGQLSEWYTDEFSEVYRRKCVACHGEIEGTTDWTGRYAWINLSRPEYSPALTAHLLADDGGRNISAVRDGVKHEVFSGKQDPDYQKMYQAIMRGRTIMEETPEADMPGFRHWKKEY